MVIICSFHAQNDLSTQKIALKIQFFFQYGLKTETMSTARCPNDARFVYTMMWIFVDEWRQLTCPGEVSIQVGGVRRDTSTYNGDAKG